MRISIVARSYAPQIGRIHFRRLSSNGFALADKAADHTFWSKGGAESLGGELQQEFALCRSGAINPPIDIQRHTTG